MIQEKLIYFWISNIWYLYNFFQAPGVNDCLFLIIFSVVIHHLYVFSDKFRVVKMKNEIKKLF